MRCAKFCKCLWVLVVAGGQTEVASSMTVYSLRRVPASDLMGLDDRDAQSIEN